MALISPLDLEQIFAVDFAGTPEVFTFVSIILIGYLMGKMKLGNTETLIGFALFGIIMSTYLAGLYVLIILLAGFVIYYSISKITK